MRSCRADYLALTKFPWLPGIDLHLAVKHNESGNQLRYRYTNEDTFYGRTIGVLVKLIFLSLASLWGVSLSCNTTK